MPPEDLAALQAFIFGNADAERVDAARRAIRGWPASVDVDAIGVGIDRTLLACAAAVGEREIVELLLARGADPNRPSWKGAKVPRTLEPALKELPLPLACSVGATDVARVLLHNGADPNNFGTDLGSPIYHGVARKDLDLIRLLVQRGADPTLEDFRPIGALLLEPRSSSEIGPEIRRIVRLAAASKIGDGRGRSSFVYLGSPRKDPEVAPGARRFLEAARRPGSRWSYLAVKAPADEVAQRIAMTEPVVRVHRDLQQRVALDAARFVFGYKLRESAWVLVGLVSSWERPQVASWLRARASDLAVNLGCDVVEMIDWRVRLIGKRGDVSEIGVREPVSSDDAPILPPLAVDAEIHSALARKGVRLPVLSPRRTTLLYRIASLDVSPKTVESSFMIVHEEHEGAPLRDPLTPDEVDAALRAAPKGKRRK